MKYYGEVANSENWEVCHKIIEVEANSVQEAYKLVNEKKHPEEDIYQISRNFDGCELPQPVYDFFNGFYEYR